MTTAKQLRMLSKQASGKRQQEEAALRISEKKRMHKMQARIPELVEDYYRKISSSMVTAAKAGRFVCIHTVTHTNKDYYDGALKPVTSILAKRLRESGYQVRRYKGKRKIDGILNYIYKIEVSWEKSEFKVVEIE